MSETGVTITPDAWLGARLGCPSYRIQVGPGVPQANRCAEFERLLTQQVFLYARIPTSDVGICSYLADRGFRVVDVNVTLEAQTLIPTRTNPTIRFAIPTDREPVMNVARNSFMYSRFHLDPHISKTTADETKASWAGNYFSGKRGDFMVVAEIEERAVGFLQLLVLPDGPLTIDLIAVEENQRGKGLARAMISFAAARCPKAMPMRVGTQAANIASIRLYESLGFRVISSAYMLHYHRGVST